MHLLLPYVIKCSWYDASPSFVVGTFLAETHNEKQGSANVLPQKGCVRSKGYYLLKLTGPVKQRQMCFHPTTARNWNALLVGTVLPAALHIRGNPSLPPVVSFAAPPAHFPWQVAKGWDCDPSAHVCPPNPRRCRRGLVASAWTKWTKNPGHGVVYPLLPMSAAWSLTKVG